MYNCPICKSEMKETEEGSIYKCTESYCSRYFNIIEMKVSADTFEIKS